MPEDADGGWLDIYERSGGVTKLVSTGPMNNNYTEEMYLFNISNDGQQAFFQAGSKS